MRHTLLALATAALCSACLYQSDGLSDVRCVNEGIIDSMRVCEDGFWVALDGPDARLDDASTPDTSVAPDAAADAANDTADAEPDLTCGPFDDDELCERAGLACGTKNDVDDQCGGTQSVFCGECADGSVCRDNQCSCDCEIGGVCFPDGATNPDAPCQVCAPNVNALGWTDVAADTPCDDGLFCTVDEVCDGAGACVGVDRDCSEVLGADPTCAVASCDEDQDTCRANPARRGTPCSNGDPDLDCNTIACDDAGACVTTVDAAKCFADGACFDAGTSPDDDPCVICLPFNSQTELAAAADGTFCGAADSCGQPTCQAGACDGFAQSAGCVIDSTCYADGDPNPNNPCEVCDPGASQTAWTADVGATCPDDGLTCTFDLCDAAGQCVHTSLAANTCLFDGAECLDSGEVSEADQGCQTCQPDGSFVPLVDGAVCATCPGGTCECASGVCVDK